MIIVYNVLNMDTFLFFKKIHSFTLEGIINPLESYGYTFMMDGCTFWSFKHY